MKKDFTFHDRVRRKNDTIFIEWNTSQNHMIFPESCLRERKWISTRAGTRWREKWKYQNIDRREAGSQQNKCMNGCLSPAPHVIIIFIFSTAHVSLEADLLWNKNLSSLVIYSIDFLFFVVYFFLLSIMENISKARWQVGRRASAKDEVEQESIDAKKF